MKTPVTALAVGTPYAIESLPGMVRYGLAKDLGISALSPYDVAAQYKALGFSVVGLPAYDCANEILVLFAPGQKPPMVSELP